MRASDGADGLATVGDHGAMVPAADQQLTARLPVLAEVPDLAAALAVARSVDRLLAELVDRLGLLEQHDVAGATTGLDLDRWLGSVAGRTRTDRRMLLRSADWCTRVPSLREAFIVRGDLSWAQTRAIVCALEALPRRQDDAVDAALGPVLQRAAGTEPDDLLVAVRLVLRHLETPDDVPRAPRRPTFTPFLAMQPRLDGSGGQLFGDLDALGFATVDAALTAPAGPVAGPTGGPDAASGPAERDPQAAAEGHGEHERPRWIGGRATANGRAGRLIALCDAALVGGATAFTPGHGRGGDGSAAPIAGGVGPMVSRPQLLLRTDLTTLLDADQVPAALLTTLTGGRLALDATSLRRLVDARGADLRTIVLDDHGRVVGVGRRRRLPPGWLTDATTALHDTCSHPGCRRGVRACDTDHAMPWHPTAPDRSPGRTDVDALAPVCRFHNRTKESGGWTVTQDAAGVRVWHHGATAVTTRTLPATWRPPPDGPAP
ncbi:MAG: hypothetical protein JJT89_15350 [Nitriliruptoraceae bacterium]|nr:hypothetical protein [Nitriliruptoraceae bacterium]